MLQWLFRRKPEPEGLRELLSDCRDRIKALERDFKGMDSDYTDLREDLKQRFGRVWSRLKSSQTDEPEETATPVAPPRPSIHDLRARFLGRRSG